MRSTLIALFLCAPCIALGQSVTGAAPANPATSQQVAPWWTLCNKLAPAISAGCVAPSISGSLSSELLPGAAAGRQWDKTQTAGWVDSFVARNYPPSFYSRPSPQWPHAKCEPIPTQWPNAKSEKIPTQWAQLSNVPIHANAPIGANLPTRAQSQAAPSPPIPVR
jgi:hypothetical protein